jgi:Glycosyl hydrolase catalytic core
MPKVIALRPHWNYSWGPKHVDAQPVDIEFVPMVWGSNDLNSITATVRDTIVPQIQRGQSKRILGFNEPDSASQANMAVSKALDAWPILEAAGVSLTSPSAVNADNAWIKSFMDQATTTNSSLSSCPQPPLRRVDWIGVHWYGSTANFDAFVNRLTRIYNLYNRQRPLLVTEFAIADFGAATIADNKNTKAQVLAFMKKALPWMEAQDWIVGYAWFSFGITGARGYSSALFNEVGELTALGRYYASVRADNPQGDQGIVPDV